MKYFLHLEILNVYEKEITKQFLFINFDTSLFVLKKVVTSPKLNRTPIYCTKPLKFYNFYYFKYLI